MRPAKVPIDSHKRTPRVFGYLIALAASGLLWASAYMLLRAALV